MRRGVPPALLPSSPKQTPAASPSANVQKASDVGVTPSPSRTTVLLPYALTTSIFVLGFARVFEMHERGWYH